MSMSPKIEKNVPMPRARIRENGPSHVINKMKIGDSILLDIVLLDSYRATANRLKAKPIVRKEGDKVRLWRTA